jgi:hypothetical protein
MLRINRDSVKRIKIPSQRKQSVFIFEIITCTGKPLRRRGPYSEARGSSLFAKRRDRQQSGHKLAHLLRLFMADLNENTISLTYHKTLKLEPGEARAVCPVIYWRGTYKS